MRKAHFRFNHITGGDIIEFRFMESDNEIPIQHLANQNLLKFGGPEALLDDKALEEMLEKFFLKATLHEEVHE